jgi:hypothetical protein
LPQLLQANAVYEANMILGIRKKLTLASIVGVNAKPSNRPGKVLEMLLDESWHAPAEDVALAFAGTDRRLSTEL